MKIMFKVKNTLDRISDFEDKAIENIQNGTQVKNNLTMPSQWAMG